MSFDLSYVVSLIFFIVILFSLDDVEGNDVSVYRVTLDANEKFNVSWTFTGQKTSDEITFTVEVQTSGWVGLGFSPKGSMAGADIIVAWVDADGKGYLKDMTAESNGLPTADSQQDVKLISSSEVDGKTMIKFSRHLDTCDGQDLELKTDTTRLIFAYGSADPTGDSLTSSDYHGSTTRGSKSIYLFDPKLSISEIPENALSSNLVISQYEIPSADTTYYCKFLDAPALDTKHHMIATEPIITEGNEGVVHHMILFACSNVTEEHMRTSNSTSGLCFAPEMPEFASSCVTVVFGWAVGGGSYVYPEGTGYPIGGPDSPKYFLLQMHYDNPGGRAGMIDSSGARLIYTPDLRDIEVGGASLGATYGLVIPPNTKDFEITTYCHSSCTNQWIPEGGITVFAYMLHAHLLGVKLRIDIYRADGTVDVFAVDNSYDFNFQETRMFREAKKIYPGDTLKMTCTMDSSERNELTLGGESTREEMCFAFISYYPRTSVSHCGSIPGYVFDPSSDFYSAINAVPVTPESDPYTVNLNATLSVLNWNSDLSESAQDEIKSTPHVDTCLKFDGTPHENPYQRFSVSDFPVHSVVDTKTWCSGMAIRQTNISLTSFLAALILALLY